MSFWRIILEQRLKNESMNLVLETERLLLRELTVEDARDTYNLNQDPEVIKYVHGSGSFESIDDARVFLEGYDRYKKEGMGRWACIIKENNEFIGWCGLIKEESGDVDLGFRLYRKNWGYGYATEAAKACLKYGFEELGLNRIVASAMAENKASINVIEKLGMTFVKYFEIPAKEDDEDSQIGEGVLYALEKED